MEQITITAKIQISVSDTDKVLLNDTMSAYSSACNYVSDYIDGTITREQFWVLAKFKYPTYQIVFCTDEALKCLNYRGFEEVR